MHAAPAPTRRLRNVLIAMMVVSIAAAVIPSLASAADTYTYRAETCGSMRGNGGSDVNGILYAACGAKIVRINAAGTRIADITITGTTFGSVAPSPDGAYLYVNIKDRLRRLDRQAGGAYTLDATWAPAPFMLAGRANKPVPRNIKTDEFGNIYISNAGTDPDTKLLAETRILKYAPNGAVMTHFGEHGDDPANPYSFFQNRGIGVSRDGRMLFVTSHLQGQIRRFDLQPDGTYAYRLTIGHLYGNCTDASGLSAVSDIGVDPWNYVYAADTTCGKIKKFTADGAIVGTIGTQAYVHVHEIAVTRKGEVLAGEWNRFYQRSASNPVPGPIPPITRPVIDTTAPVLTKLTLPLQVTTRDVQIAVTASDAVGITRVVVADEDGVWGAVKAYANPLPHTLTASAGYKRVYVKVYDAAGNESNQLFVDTQLVAGGTSPPGGGADTVAPTLRSVTVPATTTARTITVGIDAIDNVAVKTMALATEDGNWGPWIPYAATTQFTLSAGYATKGVYVKVADAAGNEVQTYRTLQYKAG